MQHVWKSYFPLALCLALSGCGGSSDAVVEERDAAVAESPGGRQTDASAEPQPLKEPNPEYYPTVVLKTSLGDVTVKLDAKRAPRTVNNFLHYAQSGHYSQTIFHQIDEGYVVLGGSYTADLTEKDNRYPIQNEAGNGLTNVRGTIAMARQPDEIDSATSQFFINLSDNPHLDHRGDSPEEFGFCVFGEVIEGLDVLDRMGELEVQTTDEFEKLPVETVLLESVRRVR